MLLGISVCRKSSNRISNRPQIPKRHTIPGKGRADRAVKREGKTEKGRSNKRRSRKSWQRGII
jgi:hypothetical protein